jgi:hypothetical protein
LGKFAVDVSRCFEALAWQNEHCAAASQWNEYLGVRIIRISSISKYHKVIFLAHFFLWGHGRHGRHGHLVPGLNSTLDALARCAGKIAARSVATEAPKALEIDQKKTYFLNEETRLEYLEYLELGYWWFMVAILLLLRIPFGFFREISRSSCEVVPAEVESLCRELDPKQLATNAAGLNSCCCVA